MFYVKIENEKVDRDDGMLKFTFSKKCYICEDVAIRDGCKEHRIPTSACKTDKSLDKMSNHFWACSYCNLKKSDDFWTPSKDDCPRKINYCGIIDCTKCDPNEYISIIVDDIEEKVQIRIVEKKYAPCIEKTIFLLRKVYCPADKMENAKLITLKENIADHLWKLICKYRRLYKFYCVTPEVPIREIEKLKEEVIKEVCPEKPFFGIKYSYLEKMYNDHLNNGFDKIIEDILKATHIHPAVNECCCNHRLDPLINSNTKEDHVYSSNA